MTHRLRGPVGAGATAAAKRARAEPRLKPAEATRRADIVKAIYTNRISEPVAKLLLATGRTAKDGDTLEAQRRDSSPAERDFLDKMAGTVFDVWKGKLKPGDYHWKLRQQPGGTSVFGLPAYWGFLGRTLSFALHGADFDPSQAVNFTVSKRRDGFVRAEVWARGMGPSV